MGLLSPHRGDAGYLFDDVDIARVHLVCDLRYDMGVGEESLPVILNLIDQLHGTRHTLKALTAAIAEQPEEIRVTITTRARHVLKGPGGQIRVWPSLLDARAPASYTLGHAHPDR